jgi:hypothetical protein
MSDRGSFDHRLNLWLDDGPDAAPREDLAAVLETFPRIRQRRRFGREIIPMPNYLRLAVAAAIVVVVGGLAVTQLRPTGEQSAGAPTPGWADRFPVRIANTFAVPFEYAIDPASGLELFGTEDPNSQRFRVPDPANPGSYLARGVVLHAVTSMRADPCTDPASSTSTIPITSADEFADHLDSVPWAKTTAIPLTVDGYQARMVEVTQDTTTPACPDIWLWPGDDVSLSDKLLGRPAHRYAALDVGGRTLVFTIYDVDDLDSWLPTAEALIDSIHFLPSGATSRP